MPNTQYDVLIVGAGIAGSALAHALSTTTSPARPKPLRIAILERSLAEPDRIVGELLQPGGVRALKQLGLEACLDGIDAIPVHGYCVVEHEHGRSVQIPYPPGHQGRSFHHGRFVMALRERAKRAHGVSVVEANVTELIECSFTKRVIGVLATRKDGAAADGAKQSFFADLVVVADGCLSNFRTAVMGSTGVKPDTQSHFVGAILEDAVLPLDKHGTVALVRGYGPVLLYQISQHDTRMLVNVKAPLPSDLKVCMLALLPLCSGAKLT
jgi:squalene monooxygenase